MLIKTIIGLGLAAMAVCAIAFGGFIPGAILTIMSLACASELLAAFKLRDINVWGIPVYAFALLACPLSHFSLVLVPVAFAACFIATAVETIFNEKRTVIDAFAGIAVMFYPILLIATLIMLESSCDEYLRRVALLMAFGAPSLADSFAYFLGVAFGKRKLCPRISPKKTVAGSIGSIIGGTLSGIAVFYLMQLIFGAPPATTNMPSMFALMGLGFVCGIIGQIGDLFASLIKRWAGIKDFGSIFPGHGGVMDRLDSIVMCAPFVLGFFVLVKLGVFSV
ncbi:MAG: phosphatidate cytidylyltransferase [Clostridia bacterium]|nr:phosphatidate cytidylyltransferase [Clostridia bacterium]